MDQADEPIIISTTDGKPVMPEPQIMPAPSGTRSTITYDATGSSSRLAVVPPCRFPPPYDPKPPKPKLT